MTNAVDALYARVSDLVPRDEFLARVAARAREFDGLLDGEAVAMMLVDEMGRNEGANVTLADAASRAEATVRIEVVRVMPEREFARADGSTGRVRNVAVRDATREATLAFWDRDTERAAELREGAKVRVVNARVKDSRFGLELVVGPWTVLEVEGALDPAKRKLLTDTLPEATPALAPALAPAPVPAPPHLPASSRRDEATERRTEGERTTPLAKLVAGSYGVEIRARVMAVGATRSFQRKDGSVGFVANVELADESGHATLACWDERAKDAAALVPGAEIVATELAVKERNGRVELGTTARSSLRAV